MVNQQTSERTEIIAGITTLVTMAYILFVNPSILSSTGMDANTALAAVFISGIIFLIFLANFSFIEGNTGFLAFSGLILTSKGHRKMSFFFNNLRMIMVTKTRTLNSSVDVKIRISGCFCLGFMFY